MAKILITLFALCLAVVLLEAKSHHHPSTTCTNNHHFDYILLATQWPESFCETAKCTPHKDQWQIHGAWPENKDGSWPQNCCTSHPFNSDLLKPIESELIAHWKTLKASGTNNEFWSHEYQKHGTCAVDSPLMKDELSYFKSTLTAFKKLNIEKWLSDSGITPSESKTYPLETFHQAIKKGLGHSAQIQCVHGKNHKFPVISQINFCLNKINLEPFDCPLSDRGCQHGSIGYLPSH